ncbi:hypothetical protein PR003_g20155 [Phytophthora rubi]|uniref:RxLR effector protein n=1 Tax=Phytophthora rubi TaxID=129364 RepID=A0A6A3K8K2_9STRA|nr:hypothetical protein PR002_g18016 [Phytophthora rubi]KAE9004452.1 hypothetical protein PR001_g17711 [Phytophthora rubi]KAE9310897.1 hypothetical protein PR003_g20155 [Phytophthora rubi]
MEGCWARCTLALLFVCAAHPPTTSHIAQTGFQQFLRLRAATLDFGPVDRHTSPLSRHSPHLLFRVV